MIKIADTTLRDGEQAPGVVFSFKDKVNTALMLEELGVDEVEIGTPAISRRDREDIAKLISFDFDFDVSCWCRAIERDIEECIEVGADIINISLPTSDILLEAMGKDRVWVLSRLNKLADKKYFSGRRISIGLQDASRADFDFLRQLTDLAHENGAFRVRFADTVGVLHPLLTFEVINRLRSETNIASIEFHGHNDLGMAVGNSVVAVSAGADYISTTVNGLGERAGNCPTEELYFALKYGLGINCGDNLSVIKRLSTHIAAASQRLIPSSKPVTGGMVYKHESGIHVDCLTKNKKSYQLIEPAESGSGHMEYVIGRHSGKAAVKEFFSRRNIFLSEPENHEILGLIKECSSDLKRGLRAVEVIDIYRNMHPVSIKK